MSAGELPTGVTPELSIRSISVAFGTAESLVGRLSVVTWPFFRPYPLRLFDGLTK
jgi:hypothetical protein